MDSAFCEHCGADRNPAVWSAHVHLDYAHFERRGGIDRGFTFPRHVPPPLSIRLSDGRVRIGRRSASRSLLPEIDISGEHMDPCVSREHAVLLAQPKGRWTVMDVGSANGTFLNDQAQPLPVLREVRVTDGSQVHVGIWTTLTVRRDPERGC